MLRNLMDAVEPGNPGLRHVCLLQGTKAYGVHLGQMPIPGKESAPRHIHPNFYWAQEDLIRERQARAGWAFTIFRPQALVGFALGSAMNMLSAIGAYAAISRELGVPLVWPGAGARYTEATDVRILARAMAWAGGAEAAANRTFNVTNGDVFLWQDLFPAGGEALRDGDGRAACHVAGRADGRQGPGLAAHRRKAPVRALVAGPAHRRLLAIRRLRLRRPGQAASILSTIAIRQAGFADCIDSAEMLDWWLADLQRRRILPD